jgi:dGTPase
MAPTLRRLRFPPERSRGRRYPELPHPYRNDFQRDRDRVVHARAFRRLENKTQVFTPGLSDHFRTRLTHTIEVAQISRTAAAALELDEDLTEALALAHDIGHPPFAHAGEEELDRQMQRFGERFDHNLHALHMVESFEQRYARFPGLNLTFEVREGIVKHSMDFEAGEFPALDEYLPGLRPTLEAQLIDLADEVAYNSADLDDAYSAGLLDMAAIGRDVPQYAGIRSDLEMHFPGADERVLFHEVLRKLIDWLVSGLIQGTFEAAEEAGIPDADAAREHPVRLARFSPEAEAANRALKRFLRERVYLSPELVAERKQCARKIGDLFAFYLEHPETLPEPYAEQTGYLAAHRVVCGYIAGMTDGFFHRTYRQLLGEE